MILNGRDADKCVEVIAKLDYWFHNPFPLFNHFQLDEDLATLVFVPYSLAFPLLQLGVCLEAPGSSSSPRLILPCVLSWGYAACLAALAVLAPHISRFQLTRASLRDARNFPEAFYDPAVVRDVYWRYRAALSRVEVGRFVHGKVGRFVALEVASYLEETDRGAAMGGELKHGAPYK